LRPAAAHQAATAGQGADTADKSMATAGQGAATASKACCRGHRETCEASCLLQLLLCYVFIPTGISSSTFSTAQHSTAQHSTAQHSTAQHSTAQHSTAQHSTAQHSTAQHSATSEQQVKTALFMSLLQYLHLLCAANMTVQVCSMEPTNSNLCPFTTHRRN